MLQTPSVRLESLFNQAEGFEFPANQSIEQNKKFFFTICKAASQRLSNGELENAYVLHIRTILFFKKLLSHKDYAGLEPNVKNVIHKHYSIIIESAENLKSELKRKFEEDYVLQQQKQKTDSNSSQLSGIDSKYNTDCSNTSESDDKNTTQELATCIDGTLTKNLIKVHLSHQLIDDFLKMSESNTLQNKETCGILCAKLDKTFIITNLLIPKQSGTSDSCTTYREEEIYEYLNSKNLYNLGWIHTHPTQTAFLSTVDQHCQLSYQRLLREAISIVCAPKFNEIKCFSLTEDYGIPFLLKCKQTGFHLHSTTRPLSEESKHVVFDQSVNYICDDLR